MPPGELLANLANLEDLNEAEVIGVVIEDGKEFESPVGSTVITLGMHFWYFSALHIYRQRLGHRFHDCWYEM